MPSRNSSTESQQDTLKVITIIANEKMQDLVRIGKKTDGKNTSDYDGTYVLKTRYDALESDRTNPENYRNKEIFFLKLFPQNKDWIEGFFEALLGNILTQLVKKKFIHLEYAACFSPAKAVLVVDAGLALLKYFIKGYKPIYTATNKEQEKKDLTMEMYNLYVHGIGYEAYLNHLHKRKHGLSYSMAIKIIFADYNFHSSNQLTAEEGDVSLFCNVNNGGAFENIIASHEQRDIFQSTEEIHTPLDFYKTIPRLFGKIKHHMDQFINSVFENESKKSEFDNIIRQAIKEIYEIVLPFLNKTNFSSEEKFIAALDAHVCQTERSDQYRRTPSLLKRMNNHILNFQKTNKQSNLSEQLSAFTESIVDALRARMCRILQTLAPAEIKNENIPYYSDGEEDDADVVDQQKIPALTEDTDSTDSDETISVEIDSALTSPLKIQPRTTVFTHTGSEPTNTSEKKLDDIHKRLIAKNNPVLFRSYFEYAIKATEPIDNHSLPYHLEQLELIKKDITFIINHINHALFGQKEYSYKQYNRLIFETCEKISRIANDQGDFIKAKFDQLLDAPIDSIDFKFQLLKPFRTWLDSQGISRKHYTFGSGNVFFSYDANTQVNEVPENQRLNWR